MDWRGAVVFGFVTLAATSVRADEAVTRQDADACEIDIHRLCEPYFPDEKRVAECLVDRRADLSAACAEALARPRDGE